MTDDRTLVVIGAGPAGLAAAGSAARAGLTVHLLDEQAEPGGQVYRALGRIPATRRALLGASYAAGMALLEAAREPGVTHVRGATVWQVEAQGDVFYSVAGRASRLRAAHVIIATGALERPMPLPGWTLPGVMSVGAAQILLKSDGIVPAVPVVLAGSGPLLYLLAWQYLRAGVEVAGLVETVPPANLRRATRHALTALAGADYLLEGWRLLRALGRAGVRRHLRARNLRVVSADTAAAGGAGALLFRGAGREQRIDCGLVLLHQGVVPNVQLSRALRIEHDWDAAGRCWRPHLGEGGQSAFERIAIAGDGAGIGGAQVAAAQGALAGLHGAARLGALSAAEARSAGTAARALLRRHLAVRPFLDALYAPDPQFLDPPDDTVLCRCESVSAADVRHHVALGALGPNQAKAYGRPGMGPCQGRLCGLAVAEVMAAARGVSPAEVGYYRLRPPIKPVTLGEVASLADAETPAAGG